ncbi:mitochondrial PGP phosphatase-domain-containing protein [Phycomyces blakesleeanus]|uniref:Mitochondrial PGP phosphatase-domain-containing protein n=1 Tax=Phycomyces blakesleeanus TaxID=4837 RepID=A0ABR3AUH0_PHYBL
MVQSFNISGIVNAFRVIWNPSLAIPHIIVNDVRNINFGTLKGKGGVQAIGFDKDNCLTAPYVSQIHQPFEEAWIECKNTFGVDNAKKLEQSLGVPVLRHSEKKPLGGRELQKHFGQTSPRQTVFVGDRIFTDVLFGNINGNLTIWTSKIVTEQGDNKAAALLRRMEYRLIKFLQMMGVQAPEHPIIQTTKDKNLFIK